MSKNLKEIPLTEVIERIIELARIREEVRKKVRGIVNDIYVRDIPKKEDWAFLMVRSAITYTQEYITGNVTGTTGGTTLTFSSAVAITSDMTGRRIKIANNDYVYDFTFAGTTSGTINPPLSGTQNVSGASYSIFQNVYALAGDFDRFPKNGGLKLFFGGVEKRVQERGYDYFTENSVFTSNDNTNYCRLIGNDTAGKRLLEVMPPPQNAISVEYDYLKQVRPLRETSAGTVTISAAATAVVGDANSRFLEATTGDYFRVDAFGTGADSEWYRIIAIADNSSMTLQSVFGNSGATSAKYTISSAPEMPVMLHPALIFGGIAQVTADQDDPNAVYYRQEYANILTDAKRVFKTRIYHPDIPLVAEEYYYRY